MRDRAPRAAESGEGQGTEHDALRSLGIGITAALGLGPAFVEVVTPYGGAGARLRFTPAYIDDETSALPVSDVVAVPRELPPGRTLVRVRRRVGLEMLGRAVRDNMPRELGLLVDATNNAPFRLTLRGREPTRVPEAPALLRVDLDVSGATRAIVEIVLPLAGFRATTTFLERGVRLATYAGVCAWDLDDDALPLRVIVDAPKLPTNASRSELRTDSELVERVRARVPSALDVALKTMQEIAFGRKTGA